MRSTHPKSRLHRQRRDARGPEQSMCREHHQVRGHPGTGRRIEAGNGQNGLHGSAGPKTAKLGLFRKKTAFSQRGRFRPASNQYEPKSTIFGLFSCLAPACFLYHKICLQGKSELSVTACGCFIWTRYAKTITDGACE